MISCTNNSVIQKTIDKTEKVLSKLSFTVGVNLKRFGLS